VSVTVTGVKEFERNLRQVITRTRTSMVQYIRDAAEGTRATAKRLAPVSPVSHTHMRDTISTRYEREGLIGIAEVTAPYAKWVEGNDARPFVGRGPGRWPPYAPIAEWVEAMRLPEKWWGAGAIGKPYMLARAVFLVRRKIGQKGTPRQEFFRPAFDAVKVTFLENVNRALSDAVASISSAEATFLR
jgi:hypothetical protein